MVIFNPKLTVEVFAIIDLNKDAKVDQAEYAAMGTSKGAKGPPDGGSARTRPAWCCT
jgi:hypothetical protein